MVTNGKLKNELTMKNRVIKILFAILFAALTSSAFGQQYLWTTVKNDTSGVKYVPLSNVTKEVLTFYDQYDYYFDLTGFSKKRFIEEINYGFENWNWLYDIKELTVSAVKSNSGSGSLIMIMCISKNNVDLLIFSNDVVLKENPQLTSSYEKNKFISWFKTILN